MINLDGILRKPDPESSSRVSSDGPFFTVVVPTMNRSKLLKAAIQTVMWQTFTDFELIISDNSNKEESRTENQETIQKYSTDSRVHYIRPVTWMNMPDHWEFATRHASGRYVVILTDRMVMRPNALKFLHSQITKSQSEIEVVSWHDSSSFDERSGLLVTGPFTGKTVVLDSKKVICDYAKFSGTAGSKPYSNRLPRQLNSCYRFDVAQRIRSEHGCLFFPISPDYTSAFLLLAYTDNIVYLDRPLYMSHGNESNGRHATIYGSKQYISSLGDVDVYSGLPLCLDTLLNLVVRDLLTVKKMVCVKLSDVELDLVGYYMALYHSLIYSERLGSQEDICASYKQWWDSVGTLAPEQQSLIKSLAEEADRSRSPFVALRRIVVRLGLAPFYHAVLGQLRKCFAISAGRTVYLDVFDAASQSDYMLTAPDET